MEPRNQKVERRRTRPNENSTRRFITYGLAVAALAGFLTTAAVVGKFINERQPRANSSQLEEVFKYNNPSREYLGINTQNI